MRTGKLTNLELQRIILSELGANRGDVVLGAGVGEDCAAIRFGEEACVLSTDPITAAGAKLGRLAVQVSVNDVAASGAEPLGVLLTVLAPPEATAEDIGAVVREAAREAAAQGVQIIGGHTEVTDAVRRMVLSATAVGRVKLEALVRTGGARPGDALVMTKQAGLEGTAILAQDAADRLRESLTEEELREARALCDSLSVLPEGRIAAHLEASAMHDATEGGVLGAAWEMAEASGLGLRLRLESIPVRPVTRKLCAALGIDPLRLIASGAMLIAHPDGEALCAALREGGVEAAVIGAFTAAPERALLHDGREEPLLPPEGDEIYGALKGLGGDHA
ncbi:MAG: AIR synthase family protein [Clostridia bacterium]|nr:AIR synthase family protein [Clostridia bacterium]